MDNDFDSAVQKQLDAAMPWVGLYIAAASAVCTLATAVDAVNSLRQKKLWFPCKYSSLNAASLTLLAVAMKLPMDLNTVMIKSETDAAAKYTSLFFMSTIVTNFMPSLGSMNDKEVLGNVVGLVILAITVTGNMDLDMDDNKRRHIMMRYWVMAESCRPQFVMARSVVSTASSIICWFSYIILFLVHIIWRRSTIPKGESSYGIYTKWILYLQSIGIIIGVIVATLRWFRIAMFRCSTTSSNSFRKQFMIEDYWIHTLMDWRNSFAGLQIRPNRCRKYVHDVKWCVLTLCIRIQSFIVPVSKMLVFFSVFIVRPFLSCFSHIRKLLRQTEYIADTDTDTDLNLNLYVLLLEGEAELPPRFVKSMCGEADRMIQTVRTKQPSSLINLLHKSVNFPKIRQIVGRCQW